MNKSIGSKRPIFLAIIFCGATLAFVLLNGWTQYFTFPAPSNIAVNNTTTFIASGHLEQSKSHNKLLTRPQADVFVLSDSMPSIQGTNITAQEIRDNFETCRKAAITRDKSCALVHNNSTLYWRSVKTNGFSQPEDINRMSLAAACCAFNHPELMAPGPSNEMFPWERDYLSQGPLADMADTAWASKSIVELADKTRTYHMGDDVTFIVRIRTGRGQARRQGGDSVRLWLFNKDIGASVTANVKDRGDGSYLATTKLSWSGKAVVKATIAHTRELFRSTLYVQRLFTTSHWLTATFKNSKASEGTPCSPLPFLPGFQSPELCNMTKYNGGNPWYCGKPVKKELNCSDIVGIIKIALPSVQPLTDADKQWVHLTESTRPFIIPSQIELVIEKERGSTLPTLPTPSLNCRDRDLATTFTEPMSTGYFYQKKWRPFACTLPETTTKISHRCLENTTVLLIGDSNTRAQMYLLQHLTQCTEKIKRTKVKWHAPLRCDLDAIGMSIQFFPQANPFYGSQGETMTQSMLTSTMTKLDSIPSTGRYIVHLHYFLHVMPFHLSITRTRLHLVRAATARLVARNPTAYVIVQSPHAAFTHNFLNKHKMNIFLYHMTKDIFAGLGNRVMFVNTMAMTIANENTEEHPSIAVEFMNIYLGHLCGR